MNSKKLYNFLGLSCYIKDINGIIGKYIEDIISHLYIMNLINKYIKEKLNWEFIFKYPSSDNKKYYTFKKENDFKLNYYLNKIAIFYNLPSIIIENYRNELNWELIFQYQSLSNYMICKYINKVDINWLIGKIKIPEKIILNEINKINIPYLLLKQQLSENCLYKLVIKKYNDKLFWKYISKYQKLSCNFMHQYGAYLCWMSIILDRNNIVDGKLIMLYKNKIDWETIYYFDPYLYKEYAKYL